MEPADRDLDPAVDHPVDETVLLGDSAVPPSSPLVSERLRLPDPHVLVPRDVLDQLADSPEKERGLAHAHQRLFYSAATPAERHRASAVAGRLNERKLASLTLPASATAYLCGPESFMTDIQRALTTLGTDPARIHTELFGARSSINPGLTAQTLFRPHQPPGPPGSGPRVTFARSGISAPFPGSVRTVLELAEACDIPTRWSCRTGVCHTCITALLSGRVSYAPDPLDPPTVGEVLICCARPDNDTVLDL